MINIYRVSQEECEILRESVPYVKVYRYNPKHLYPKLNGYGVNRHRKVWVSVVSTNCTPSVMRYSSTAQARQADFFTVHRKTVSAVQTTSHTMMLSGYKSDCSKRRIGNDLDGSGSGKIWGNIPQFTCRDWQEPRNSIGTAGFPTESLRRYLPNRSHKVRRLSWFVRWKTCGAKQIVTEGTKSRKTETKRKCKQKNIKIKRERKAWLNEINKEIREEEMKE